MNAPDLRLTFIAAAVFLANCSLLQAVPLDEPPVSDEGGQTTVAPQTAVTGERKSFERTDIPERTLAEWKIAIATVKANWLDSPDVTTIRKDIQSGCTALQYRQLLELDSDPLNFGPSLAFGRQGYVAGFKSASELGAQIAWLKAHGLLMDWTASVSSTEISNGVLVNVPMIRELATNPIWNMRLLQDRATTERVSIPFKRILIDRRLNDGFAHSQKSTTGATYIDVTRLEIGNDFGEAFREAFTLNFFPLLRDDGIRRQLASTSDAAVYFIVYPDNAEFRQVLNDSAAGNAKLFHFKYSFGNHTMGVHEQSIPVHGWEAAPGHGESTAQQLRDNKQDETSNTRGDETASQTQHNSETGGDSGMGGGGFPSPGPAGNQRYVGTKEVIIAWSETNDELRGFSVKKGDWEVIKIAPQKAIIPIVGQNIAAVRFGDSLAAFSGETGHWDVIELSKDSKSEPIVGQDIAAVRFGNSVAAFSGETGHWDVIELSKDSKSRPFLSDSLVQIEDNGHLYTFSTEKASWTSPTDMTLQETMWEESPLEIQSSSDADFSRKVQQLINEFRKWNATLPRYKRDRLMIRTLTGGQEGTIEYRAGRQTWMPELKSKVEELCRLVEVSDPAVKTEGTADAASQVTDVKELARQIQAMQSKLNALRSIVAEASDTTQEPDDATLRKHVEEAFDARQQLQKLEAEKLRLKLEMIESGLQLRLKNRERIIEQRVAELLSSGVSRSSALKQGGPTADRIDLPRTQSDTDNRPERSEPQETESGRIALPASEGEQTRTTPQGQVFWDELRAIEDSLSTLRTKVTDARQDVINVGRRLEVYRTPFSDWDPAVRDELRAAVVAAWGRPGQADTRIPNDFGTLTFQLDFRQVVDANRKHYGYDKGIPGRFAASEFPEDANLNPTTDQIIEGIRLDLVRMLEERQAAYLGLEQQYVRKWRNMWGAYQSRTRLYQLDVDAAQATREPVRQQLTRMIGKRPIGAFSKGEIEKQEAQLRLAEIQLLRARELLRLYTDIEKNEPQLNPDYIDPEADAAADVKAEQ